MGILSKKKGSPRKDGAIAQTIECLAKCGEDSLEGKVFIVTGANSGVGLGTARALVLAGATVILACRNSEAGQRTAEELNQQLWSSNSNISQKLRTSHRYAKRSSSVESKTELECDSHVFSQSSSQQTHPFEFESSSYDSHSGDKSPLILSHDSEDTLTSDDCSSGRNKSYTPRARQFTSTSRVRAPGAKFMHIDLSDLASIKDFADAFTDLGWPLHGLINNAGVFQIFAGDPCLTKQSYEGTWGVNHLGTFYLTYLLLEKLRQSAPSRIVIVSSNAHEYSSMSEEDFMQLPLSIEHLKRKSYSWSVGYRMYADSKLLNVMLTKKLHRMLKGSGVSSYSVHPGLVRSNIATKEKPFLRAGHKLARYFWKSEDRGAATSIYCALHPDALEHSGVYHKRCRPRADKEKPLANNERLQDILWERTEAIVLNFQQPEPSHLSTLSESKTQLESSGTDLSTSHTIMHPRNLQDLRSCMQDVVDRGGSLKACGTRHSCTFSDIADTQGVTIDCRTHLNSIGLELDTSVMISEAASLYKEGYLMKCEAGATYRDINDSLWPPHERLSTKTNQDTGKPYKVVWDHPGYVDLTLGGTISVGSQGSSARSMMDSVRAIHLITVNRDRRVVQIQIEQSNGITNPKLFSRKDVELIQDDDVFNAALVSFGTMGVVYAYTFEVMDAFYVKEERTSHSLEDLTLPKVREVLRLMDEGTLQSWEMWINPYKFHGRHRIVLGPKYYTDESPSSRNNPPRGVGLRAPRFAMKAAAAVTRLTARHVPSLLPAVLNVALSRTTQTRGATTLPATTARDFGSPNWIPATGRATAAGVGIDCADAQSIIDAIHRTCAEAERLRTEDHLLGASPFSVRLMSQGTGFLAPQHGRRTALIEWPNLTGVPRGADVLRRFTVMMQQEMDARPYWGLFVQEDLDFEDLRKQYSHFPKFVEQYERLNPLGVFSNAFSRRLGLDGPSMEASLTETALTVGGDEFQLVVGY